MNKSYKKTVGQKDGSVENSQANHDGLPTETKVDKDTKGKKKQRKVFSTILQIFMFLGILILNGIINSLSEIKEGSNIAFIFFFMIVLFYVYMLLVSLLTKESILAETKDYQKRKWYKKSKVWFSVLIILISLVSFFSISISLGSIIITSIIIIISLLTLVAPRITVPILIIYLLADLIISFTTSQTSVSVVLGSLLTKGAYILLAVRVFLVASKLNLEKKVKIVFKKKNNEQTFKDSYSSRTKDDNPSYTPARIKINKIIIWGLSISLFILIWIGIFSLLGFKINKKYFSYNEDTCIADNWTGNRYHKGIDDCIYWDRYNKLIEGRNLQEEWNTKKETLMNCPSNCMSRNLFGDYFYSPCNHDSSVICNYSDYIDFIHYSNQDYLKSKKKDSSYEKCGKEFCKRPPIITLKEQ